MPCTTAMRSVTFFLALTATLIGNGGCDTGQDAEPPPVSDEIRASGDCDLASPTHYAYVLPAFRSVGCVDAAGNVTATMFDEVTLPGDEFQYFPITGGAVITVFGAFDNTFDTRVARVSGGEIRLVAPDGPAPSDVFQTPDGQLFTTRVSRSGDGFVLTFRLHNRDFSVAETVSAAVGPYGFNVRSAALRGRRAVLSANAIIPDGEGGFDQNTRATLLVVDLDAGTASAIDRDAPLTSSLVLVGSPLSLFYGAFEFENIVVYRRDLTGGAPERLAEFGSVSSTYSSANAVPASPNQVATIASDAGETRILVFNADGSLARSGRVEGSYRGMERSASGDAFCLRRFITGRPTYQGVPPASETFTIVDAQSLETRRSDVVPLDPEFHRSLRFSCQAA